MQLSYALRLAGAPRLAFVGAGGKTTAMFRLARQLPPPVWVTATTHLGLDQLNLADRCKYLPSQTDLNNINSDVFSGVTLFMKGPAGESRTHGLDFDTLDELKRLADASAIPLLVEADGSRTLPLKAPAAHEPAIPPWVDTVVVTAGLSGLGQPLVEAKIHRPELFSEISGLPMGLPVRPEDVVRVLLHPKGGLKNIPPGARKIALLNQADTPDLKAQAAWIADKLLPSFDAILISVLHPVGLEPAELDREVFRVIEPAAAIILAGGGSRRLAQPKQLLEWRGEPLVRHAARTAVQAGLDPVVVVTGAEAGAVEAVVSGLPVRTVHNPEWEGGQSTSIQVGIRALPSNAGSAVFLLSDQPQVPVNLVERLIDAHSHSLASLVAPRVHGRRANPVLFDRVTFPDLLNLRGDVGGRAVFERYPLSYVDWDDDRILLDVDTMEDYQRLLEIE